MHKYCYSSICALDISKAFDRLGHYSESMFNIVDYNSSQSFNLNNA